MVGFIGGKFLPLHHGHIFAITVASTYVQELYVVLTSSPKRDRQLCEESKIKYISPDVRLAWLGESLADLENVILIHIEDDQGVDDYDWHEGAKQIKKAIGKPITYVFSSEPSYDKRFKEIYPDAKHVIIDLEKKKVPISSTVIRENIYKNWWFLPDPVKAFFVKKVVIVGTESSGKSVLVRNLARIYRTNCVPEVGREYCEKFMNQFTVEMFDDIAMKHYLLQKERIKTSNKVIFVDTEAIITQYYLDMYCNATSSFLESLIQIQNYDLWIYLEPDVVWVEDGYRFAGEESVRQENNEKLKKMLRDRGINFVSVKGNYSERLSRVMELVDGLLSEQV